MAGAPAPKRLTAATPERLFAAVRADDSARPIVTFYDDATGERAELSAASLGNWIAKTCALLTDELGLGTGERAYVALPLHWLDIVVRLGVWAAGLEITDQPADAVVAFVDEAHVAAAQPAGDVFALALLPWGRGFAGAAPSGSVDYVDAVRPQADAWPGLRLPASGPDPALAGRTRSDVLDEAAALVEAEGWPAAARVLVTGTTDRPVATATVLAAWSVRGSVVLVRHAAPDAPDRLRDQENITHQIVVDHGG